jgi:hypothetical protein
MFGLRDEFRVASRRAMGRIVLWGKHKIAQPILGAISRMAFRTMTRVGRGAASQTARREQWQASQEASLIQLLYRPAPRVLISAKRCNVELHLLNSPITSLGVTRRLAVLRCTSKNGQSRAVMRGCPGPCGQKHGKSGHKDPGYRGLVCKAGPQPHASSPQATGAFWR